MGGAIFPQHKGNFSSKYRLDSNSIQCMNELHFKIYTKLTNYLKMMIDCSISLQSEGKGLQTVELFIKTNFLKTSCSERRGKETIVVTLMYSSGFLLLFLKMEFYSELSQNECLVNVCMSEGDHYNCTQF